MICVGFATQNWLWSILVLALGLLIGGIVSTILKEEINLGLRAVHFLMAVACRAHNNSLFLRHGVELRPGYLGKWLEL